MPSTPYSSYDRAKRAAARILAVLGYREGKGAEVVVTENDPLCGLDIDVAEIVASRLEDHQKMLTEQRQRKGKST